MTIQDPAAQRRRLRVELKKARTAAKLTQKDVAAALDWSPSKIIRIESGAVSVSTTDLRALLAHYEVRDKRLIEQLVVLARGSKRQPFSAFRDILSPETMQFFGYEASAQIIRSFENQLVPGLLQTEEYTRAVLTGVYRLEGNVVDKHIEVREERKEQLERLDGRKLNYIIDEAVVRRVVGGPAVMQHQLEHLALMAKEPEISLAVVPFPKGANPGMRGPFIHLEFGDPDDADAVYFENARGDAIFRDAPEVTTEALNTFWELEELAKTEELQGFIDTALTKLPAADTDEQQLPSVEKRGAGV